MDVDQLRNFHEEAPDANVGNLSTKVTLKDFIISCSPEDSANSALDGMAITIHGLEEKDTAVTARTEKINPTRWKYHREIRLHSGMDELTLSIQSEDAGDIGYIAFSKDELAAFILVDHNIELERNFIELEENSPSLRLTFTLGPVSQKATPEVGVPPSIMPYMERIHETMQNTEMFSTVLKELVEHPELLNFLGDLFKARFFQTHHEDDINKALEAYKLAVQLTAVDDANYGIYLSDCGYALVKRFELSGNLQDINQAISMTEDGIAYSPEDNTNYPLQLMTLGTSFFRRFARTGNLADVSNAISTLQKAVHLIPEGHTHMANLLSDLGLSYRGRFEHTGDLADITSAISTCKKVVQLTPEGHPDMPSILNNLGISFQARFKRSGSLGDMASAISTLQRAVHLTPEGDVHLPSWLNNLGNSFQLRFRRTGDLADISSAISTLHRAIQLTPEGYPDILAVLSNLGCSFQMRFERTGDLADIASSISTLQRVVHLTPEGNIHMPLRLTNLGNAFWTRCKFTGNLADIGSAISTLRRAVELTPEGHADMPSWLNNLGLSYGERFEHTGDIEDITSAISTYQRAIQLTSERNAHMPTMHHNLGNSFQARFERTSDPADITSAISASRTAIRLMPEGHAHMPSLLNDLGNSFQMRFQSIGTLTDHPDIGDIHEAISMFHRSATQTTGDTSIRFEAARKWAQLSRKHDKSQSLSAFSIAIQLLPQLAGLEQTIRKRHYTLTDVSDITASATAAAIDDSELDMALAWLEQGRCLVWNQLNYLRTPADDLQAYNPWLADRFLRVARDLEASGCRREQHTIFSEEDMSQMTSLQEESHTHIHLAKEWNDLLLEIRRIPEFHDFLQPPQVSKLLNRLPLGGPVVIFNLHEDRCDALALLYGLDCPIHIPLETFSLQKANQLCKDIRKYLTDHRVRQRQEAERGIRFRLRPKGVDMYDILRELWEHVAKPILDALAYSPHHSNQPRIWWCPTGPLAFLPIHAAGIYGKGKAPAGPCVSDYVVSSYIPSVSALLDKISQVPTTYLKPTSLLIISQPSTPGQSTIPGAKQEAQALIDMIGPPPKSLLLEDAFATVMRVKEEMRTHDCVHFACHAIQDADDSLKSGVQLHDGRLELLEMMKQTLPNADLAFLSACQTSTGDEKLSDEAVHLAAGMLAAGYRSVVATMWSIKDEYGPVIAKAFYSHILPENSEVVDKRLDGADAARGLHYATQKIRMELGDTEEAFLTWVPYVHFGV